MACASEEHTHLRGRHRVSRSLQLAAARYLQRAPAIIDSGGSRRGRVIDGPRHRPSAAGYGAAGGQRPPGSSGRGKLWAAG